MRTPTRALVIYVVSVVVFGANGARNLLVPLYADSIGASRAEIGLLFTAFAISAAALAVPAGLLANRLGHRNVILLSTIASGISQLVAGSTREMAVLFACQVLGGLSSGAIQTVLMTALADAVPPQRIGSAMGWQTLAGQVGQLAGPAVAGVLLAWVSVRTGLLLVPLLFVLATVLGYYGVAPRARSGPATAPGLFDAVRDLATAPGFLKMAFLALVGTLVFGTTLAYLPVFGRKDLGLSPSWVGYLLAVQAVANGAARLPAGRIVDRLSGPRLRTLTATGIAVYSAGLVVLPHTRGFLPAVAVLVMMTPFIATSYVALPTAFSQFSSRSRSVALGIFSLLIFAGSGIGPALVAPAMQMSFAFGFTAAGVGGVVLVGLVVLARRPGGRQAEPLPVPLLP